MVRTPCTSSAGEKDTEGGEVVVAERKWPEISVKLISQANQLGPSQCWRARRGWAVGASVWIGGWTGFNGMNNSIRTKTPPREATHQAQLQNEPINQSDEELKVQQDLLSISDRIIVKGDVS